MKHPNGERSIWWREMINCERSSPGYERKKGKARENAGSPPLLFRNTGPSVSCSSFRGAGNHPEPSDEQEPEEKHQGLNYAFPSFIAYSKAARLTAPATGRCRSKQIMRDQSLAPNQLFVCLKVPSQNLFDLSATKLITRNRVKNQA